jgi:hypothetical protein
MAKRILIITYCFPPINLPEATLCAKALSGINKDQFDVVTIGSKPSEHDNSFMKFVSNHFQNVFRIRRSKIIEFFISLLLKKRSSLLKYPDSYIFYTPQLLITLWKTDWSKYDRVITWSQWHSVHMSFWIWRFLSPKVTNLFWLAKFSDPWSDNQYNQFTPFQKKVNRLMEQLIIRGANRLVFVTEETRSLYMDKYPPEWKSKSAVIPHCYSPELYSKQRHRSSKLLLRYLGSFYGERTPTSLFAAINDLKKIRPNLENELALEIFGNESPELENWISKYNLKEIVNFKGHVSYIKSLKLMASTDVLVSIDAPSDVNPFLSSKIIDYLGSKNPIIAVGSTKGATARLITKIGLVPLDFSDVNGMAKIISEYIAKKQNGGITFTPPKNVIEQYESSHVSQSYLKLLAANQE